MSASPKQVADLYLRQIAANRVAHRRAAGDWSQARGMSRTAGEVRFIKDRSDDKGAWAYVQGPEGRMITPDFDFNSNQIKPMVSVLHRITAAMGHSVSAYTQFAKIKSRLVSPDGSLGGKGYIQKIPEMRRQLTNVVEALSSMSDTLYDEVKAPHWASLSRKMPDDDAEETKDLMDETDEIRSDPEEWSDDQAEESAGS